LLIGPTIAIYDGGLTDNIGISEVEQIDAEQGSDHAFERFGYDFDAYRKDVLKRALTVSGGNFNEAGSLLSGHISDSGFMG